MELARGAGRREGRERNDEDEWNRACGALLARVRTGRQTNSVHCNDESRGPRAAFSKYKANLSVDAYTACRVLAVHGTWSERLIARLEEEEDTMMAEIRGDRGAAHAGRASAVAYKKLKNACRCSTREYRKNSRELAYLYDPVLMIAEAAKALPRPSAYQSSDLHAWNPDAGRRHVCSSQDAAAVAGVIGKFAESGR